jgi:hypothetical protein
LLIPNSYTLTLLALVNAVINLWVP